MVLKMLWFFSLINMYLPQHHAQFFHMDSGLAFQVLSKHLALKVDFLEAVLKVHYTLKVETWLVKVH